MEIMEAVGPRASPVVYGHDGTSAEIISALQAVSWLSRPFHLDARIVVKAKTRYGTRRGAYLGMNRVPSLVHLKPNRPHEARMLQRSELQLVETRRPTFVLALKLALGVI